MGKKVDGIIEFLMSMYDLASELKDKEGKSHRETFKLILKYVKLEFNIGVLEGQEAVILERIKELKAQLVISTALAKGTAGKG